MTIVDGKVVGVTVIYSITTAATPADNFKTWLRLRENLSLKRQQTSFLKPIGKNSKR